MKVFFIRDLCLDPAFYREEPFDYNENQRKLNLGLRLEPDKVERPKKAENKREETGLWGVFGLEVERMKRELELLEAERELLKMPVGVGRKDNDGLKENSIDIKEHPPYIGDNEENKINIKENPLYRPSINRNLFGQGHQCFGRNEEKQTGG